MGSPQEPRELLLGETNRQRKWAPRTRTGCLTCRTRRIKCDEAKPACRQCIKSCVECRGLLYGKPEGNHPGILQEIVPPSWDFLQSIQYYLSNMAPSLQQGRVIMNRLPKSVYQQRRLITLVITDRIERASKARGHPLHAGQDTAFAGIWITFTRYKLEHIGYANQLLKNDEQHECEIFSVINLLIRLDLIMQNTSWQSHMKGYLTYMEYLGGVEKVLALPIPPHTHSISSRISTCICVNTTSPATRQFTAIYRLNDEHIEAAIASCCGDNFFGCPPRVQMAIFHISKLRLLAVCNAKIKEQEFVDKIQYIAQGLDHVDVEEWAREKLGDLPETATLATIFRTMTVAVRLYGILSLPKNYAAAWLAPSSRGTAGSRVRDRLDVYHRVRIWHRERLLELLRITRDKLCDPKISRLFTWSVGWPLLVAGVAAADGSKETHELITGTLITLSQKPNVPFCVMTAVEKLRRFWRLELTEWDECFSEPLVLYL